MKNSFTITQPQPCSQQWDIMPSRAEGRFCGSCQQIVVDFTRMTDQELVAYFQSNSGSLCGILAPSQTDRIITPAPKSNVRFTLPGVVVTLVSLFISFSGRAQTSHAIKREQPTTLTPLPAKPLPITPTTAPSIVPPANISPPLQGRLGGVCIQPIEVKQSWQDRINNRIEDILRYF